MSGKAVAAPISVQSSAESSEVDVEAALQVFKGLSITIAGPSAGNSEESLREKGKKFGEMESTSIDKKKTTCRNLDQNTLRFRPYNIPRFRLSKFAIRRKRKSDNEADLAVLDGIKLCGCAFNGNSLPAFSSDDRKPSTSPLNKPCWMQYREEQQSQVKCISKADSSSTLPSECGDSAVDELSEYFDCFVTVKMKMSSQAESMYA